MTKLLRSMSNLCLRMFLFCEPVPDHRIGWKLAQNFSKILVVSWSSRKPYWCQNQTKTGSSSSKQKLMQYELSLCVHKLYNLASFNHHEFIRFNINQIFTSIQENFICSKSNIQKIGLNCLVNRLHSINNLIPLNWLRSSLNSYKIKCKELMLSNWCFQNPKMKLKYQLLTMDLHIQYYFRLWPLIYN